MHTKTIASVALFAGAASARAIDKASQYSPALEVRQTTYGQAVYWGQGSGERTLGSYCTDSEGISIIVLSFLYSFGSGITPNGFFGTTETCTVDTSGNGSSGCATLAADIETCKANGVKVFVSLGGATSTSDVTSQSDAEAVALSLWNSYANPVASTDCDAPRPFGDTFVDGWDFDIEYNPNGSDNTNDQYIVDTLRSYFPTDPSNTYYISGAPQCYLPEANMGTMISASQFDYLFIQFYNNPSCSAYQYVRPEGDYGDAFNFDTWYGLVQGGASAAAQLYVGLPASELASNGDESGAVYYLSPTELQTLLGEYKSHAGFGGVMLWEAALSDANTQNGCSYAKEVDTILTTGNTC